MDSVSVILIFILAGSFLLGMRVLLIAMIFPAAWGRMIDRVHDYFLCHGIISSRVSNQMKVLEKGIVVRLGIAAVVLVIAMDLAVCVMRYVLGLRI